jgi:hypothetical protein
MEQNMYISEKSRKRKESDLTKEDRGVTKRIRCKIGKAIGIERDNRVDGGNYKWLTDIFQRALQRGGDITNYGKKKGKGGLAQRISEDKMPKIRKIWYGDKKFRDILWKKNEYYPKNRQKLIDYIMQKGTQEEKNKAQKYLMQKGTQVEKDKFLNKVPQSQLQPPQNICNSYVAQNFTNYSFFFQQQSFNKYNSNNNFGTYSNIHQQFELNTPTIKFLPIIHQNSAELTEKTCKRKRPKSRDDTDNIVQSNKKRKKNVTSVTNQTVFFTSEDEDEDLFSLYNDDEYNFEP